MNKNSRVFVIQDLGFSFKDAEDNFGELIFLLPRKESNVFNIATVRSMIKKRLWDAGFRDDDYLLAVGAPALLMVAGIEANALVKKGFSVLQWDRKEKKYYSINIRRT